MNKKILKIVKKNNISLNNKINNKNYIVWTTISIIGVLFV